MRVLKMMAVAIVLVATAGCVSTKRMQLKAAKHLKLEVFGGYHPQEVGLGMRKIYPELKTCHQANGSPVGRMVVQYTIASVDGSVKDPKAVNDFNTIKNPGLDSCVTGAISALKYDKMNSGNDSKVVYPLIFPLD